MASQVGQGYNPEVSLLQGGTAPILPVQGGGGDGGASVPAGYNPDTSLLNTGVQAQITAIRGGGNGDAPDPETLPPPSTFVPLDAASAPDAETLPPPDNDEKKNEKKNSFQADPSAVKAKEKRIELNAREYMLRIPFEKGVKEDWLKGKFTEEEVEFLKALQFTPSLLANTFGNKQWKPLLVEFLEKIHVSKCFQDTTLLTYTECSTAQQFVKKVYLQLYNQMLEGIYDSMGVVKPSKLVDVLFRLKELGDTGMLKESMISKYDYTGDLLDRFQTIHRNSKSGDYSFDFAEMTEATRDILNKMKLYRAEDTDIEEITRIILERMNIPIPPTQPQAGGEEEVFDLGEPINKKRSYRKETLRKKSVKRKTRKQNTKRKVERHASHKDRVDK